MPEHRLHRQSTQRRKSGAGRQRLASLGGLGRRDVGAQERRGGCGGRLIARPGRPRRFARGFLAAPARPRA